MGKQALDGGCGNSQPPFLPSEALLAGYLRYEGLILLFPEIYLRYEGLLPEYASGQNGGMTVV